MKKSINYSGWCISALGNQFRWFRAIAQRVLFYLRLHSPVGWSVLGEKNHPLVHRWLIYTSFLRLPYTEFFGGVSGLTVEQFQKINGFPNAFWGWGGEDDDLWNRYCLIFWCLLKILLETPDQRYPVEIWYKPCM